MTQVFSIRLRVAAVGAVALAVCLALSAHAADEAAATKKRAEPRGRLPAHYGDVVNDQQREAIYKIQDSYDERIEEARAKLQKIIDERDQKVAAVLTAEQRAKVASMAEAAKAKRADGTSEPQKVVTKKPVIEDKAAADAKTKAPRSRAKN